MGLGAAWVVTAACATVSAGSGPSRFEFAETHMGSECRLVLYTAREADARRASAAAFARIAELDRELSDYDPDSELMRLCARAGGDAVPVSDDLFRILVLAQAWSRETDGRFDVSIQPVVRLWRRARREGKLPDPAAIARAKALVDYRNIRLDASAKTVRLLKAGMKLDLGGIAKGYAAQAAADVLHAEGVPVCLAAIAGDIVAGDPPPDAKGWRVGIGPLDNPDAPPKVFVLLANRAVSTSGDAERHVEVGGRRYSHIVDPRTGVGLVERASVTVVACDGATADALATSVYLLGPEAGTALVERTPGAAAYIVRRDEGGRETILTTRRWDAIPVAGPK